MAAHVLAKEHIVYAMTADNVAVLQVADGDEVVVHTCDCFEDQIQSEDQDFGGIDWDKINPATGPIYVEGALPGDLLVVDILHIELADRGVMTTGPDLGVLGDELTENVIRMMAVRDGRVFFGSGIELPVHPMIGVIGTAPATGSVPCGTPGAHGGNMDCKRIAAGAKLILPVNVPGALLALGDLHATMGDGEAAVCGVEIAGAVTLRVHVLKGKDWPVPMLLNETTVMTIASRQTLDAAAEWAVKNMVHLLEQACGVDKAEATFLMSVAGDLRICQVVDPLKTARYELPRRIAEQYGFRYPLLG